MDEDNYVIKESWLKYIVIGSSGGFFLIIVIVFIILFCVVFKRRGKNDIFFLTGSNKIKMITCDAVFILRVVKRSVPTFKL
jgi:hypothetical protein